MMISYSGDIIINALRQKIIKIIDHMKISYSGERKVVSGSCAARSFKGSIRATWAGS